jgi:hypothetical protein
MSNPKPYCKVCHDAGKPESVYTSHWVKTLPDKNGKSNVICPTLLDTECRYCFKFGHTTKFCPIIEKNNKKREKDDRRTKLALKQEQNNQFIKKNTTSKSGAFAILDFETDSEDELKEINVSNIKNEEFPSFTNAESKPIEFNEIKTGWAAIVAKPKAEKPTIFGCPIELSKPKLERQNTIKMLKSSEKTAPAPAPAPWTKNEATIKKSWADYSESEDDEELEATWKSYEEDDMW